MFRLLKHVQVRRAPAGPPSHADLFMERYEQMWRWACHFTEDSYRAQDLLHDAFVQFSLSRPDLSRINNLDAYLCILLRNLHYSELRRHLRRSSRELAIIDSDSAEFGLMSLDPRDHIQAHVQAQDELRIISEYACSRKEDSKSASVLILRFFHGYYPGEIAQILGRTRQLVDRYMRLARQEAKEYLASYRQPSPGADTPPGTKPVGEFLQELRAEIFRSRTGDCMSKSKLVELYRGKGDGPIDCKTLSHFVSCPECLDRVSEILGLPPRSERDPDDSLGPDDSTPRGPRLDAPNPRIMRRSFERRARNVYEHKPRELCIAVNGAEVSRQRIGSELSESLTLNLPESIGFVEVFSEAGVRLLFLNVIPAPDGTIEQSCHVVLSHGRSMQVEVDFRDHLPKLHISYCDPDLRTADDMLTDLQIIGDEESLRVFATPSPAASTQGFDAAVLKPLWNWLRLGPAKWLRPATVMATLIFVVSLALYFSHKQPSAPPTAAELLRHSILSEHAATAHPELLTHRTIALEERKPSTGEVIANHRIELWQDAAGKTVRRMYGENGQMIAGEWPKADGSRVVYQNATLRTIPGAQSSPFATDAIWMLTPSSEAFAQIAAHFEKATVEEQPDVYVLRYKNAPSTRNPRLLEASLTLRRSDLHGIEERLQVEQDGQKREYRFVEVACEQRHVDTVPRVFDIDAVTRPASGIAALAPAFVPANADLKVEVLGRLDSVNALLREQIQVTRTSDGVLSLDGVVENQARKSELFAVLGGLAKNAAVRVAIVADHELQPPLDRNRQRLIVQAVEGQETSASSSTVRDYLAARKHLSGAALDEETTLFCNSVVSRSVSAQLHTTVLKHIARSLSAAEVATLSPESRQKWLALQRHHAEQVRHDLAAIRNELLPVFGAANAGAEAVAAGGDLNSTIVALADSTAAVDEAVGQSLAASSNASAQAVFRRQFWQSLNTAEAAASAILEKLNCN